MKVVLAQPNYAWFSKRSWESPPYTLAVLNACLKDRHDVKLFDPNYTDMSEDEVFEFFNKERPDIAGVTTGSTEYIKPARLLNEIIKKASPETIIIQGGIIPTVVLDIAMKDGNVDYWVIGEGELRLPRLLEELAKPAPDLASIDGLAYWEGGTARISPSKGFIEDLDSLPFADYGNIDFIEYGNRIIKYAAGLLPRQYPYAVTITSRGCPFRCIFCAASLVSGKKVRFRSAENILKEIDLLYKAGVREVMFLDDHFLAKRKRAVSIMEGLIERKYDMTWKSVNLMVNFLDREILELMRKSGCYQLILSLESGNQDVLKNIIKKPIKLAKVADTLKIARSLGFETIANFVFGFPDETRQQIDDTLNFARNIDVDLVNFHIATPLPETELMKICLEKRCLPEDFDIGEDHTAGYAKGVILTDEFTPSELEVLRASEWDKINFSTPERKKAIARIEAISLEELEEWRKKTRRRCGVDVVS